MIKQQQVTVVSASRWMPGSFLGLILHFMLTTLQQRILLLILAYITAHFLKKMLHGEEIHDLLTSINCF